MKLISTPFKKLFKKNDQNHAKQEKDQNEKQKINPTILMNKNMDYVPIKKISQNYQNMQREQEFQTLLDAPIIDYDKLKQLSWNGIPHSQRNKAWKVLLKYLPTNLETQKQTLKSKRNNYFDMVNQYFGESLIHSQSYQEQQNQEKNSDQEEEEEKDETERKIFKLINDDVKRTLPDTVLFRNRQVYDLLVRVLYIWNMRHPACGYVQGINDICTPFIIVFISDYVNLDIGSLQFVGDRKVEDITEEQWKNMEADCYWCLTRILDGVLDNYTNKYPGLQKCYEKVKDIFNRTDKELLDHFEEQGINFYTITFKWIICLLLRQFTPEVGLRLFDTYLADDQGYATFQIYIFTAIILKWSKKLKSYCFEEMMIFLQEIPTKNWTEEDLEMAISEAYYYQSLFEKNQQ